MRSFILIIIVILGITGCSFDKTVSVIEKKEIKTQYQVVDDKGNILDFTDTPRRIYAMPQRSALKKFSLIWFH